MTHVRCSECPRASAAPSVGTCAHVGAAVRVHSLTQRMVTHLWDCAMRWDVYSKSRVACYVSDACTWCTPNSARAHGPLCHLKARARALGAAMGLMDDAQRRTPSDCAMRWINLWRAHTAHVLIHPARLRRRRRALAPPFVRPCVAVQSAKPLLTKHQHVCRHNNAQLTVPCVGHTLLVFLSVHTLSGLGPGAKAWLCGPPL